MIVSDAGPIIIFARIGRLSLLQEITTSLLIPNAVYDEIVTNKGGMPGAAEVAQAIWDPRKHPLQKARPAPLSSALQKGELEAIALAKERAEHNC